MFRRKHVVEIIYKSGMILRVRCEDFTVKFNAFNAVQSVQWVGAKPRPLHLALDQVESIWQVR